MKNLSDELKNVDVVVDNPGGMIHNYMARKPYFVVSQILRALCDSGSVVLDPMFGSGTTIIEAAKLGLDAIGIDINPLAFKLASVSLRDWNLEEAFGVIDDFLNGVRSKIGGLYYFKIDGLPVVLERCHFDLNASSELVPTFLWAKEVKENGALGPRKKYCANDSFARSYSSLSRKTKFIKNSKLIPNSRIAIKPGRTVFDYFCNRNLRFLDLLFETMSDYLNNEYYDLLEILVSSSINLIKLSDKKASSQMPFWLPKKNITSRNALFVLEEKAALLKDGLSFFKKNLIGHYPGSSIRLFNEPAQLISKEKLPDNSVDLILTDPPYTDQVPYLEYNQIQFSLFKSLKPSDFYYQQEMIVSDAASRKKDREDFDKIFEAVFRRVCESLKPKGYFVMFYHTFDLSSWSKIMNYANENGLAFSSFVKISAPRKSFKTVMSPKATLDGNFLVVFEKEYKAQKQPISDINEGLLLAKNKCVEMLGEAKALTSQDFYDNGLLEDAVRKGYLDIVAQSYGSFVPLFKKWFKNDDGVWRAD